MAAPIECVHRPTSQGRPCGYQSCVHLRRSSLTVHFDTNILLRLSDRADSKHVVTPHAVEQHKQDGRNPGIVPQVLNEYWVVVTRTRADNGLGLCVKAATASLTDWMSSCRRLPEGIGTRRHSAPWWQSVRSDVAQVGRAGAPFRELFVIANGAEQMRLVSLVQCPKMIEQRKAIWGHH